MAAPHNLMPNNHHYSVIMDKVHGYENTAVLGVTPEYNILQHSFNQSKASSINDPYSKLNHSTTTLNTATLTDSDIYTSLDDSVEPLYKSLKSSQSVTEQYPKYLHLAEATGGNTSS